MKNKLSITCGAKNFILRPEEFTFTIYHHSPYLINVTGLKSFEELQEAQKIAEGIFQR